MKDVNWKRITDEKNVVRAKNAARPYGEKLERLDKLRDRSAVLRGEGREGAATGRLSPARKK